MSTETDKKTDNLVKKLFEVGAHFGFSKSRRHPSVAPFLFGNKQGNDIFDLEKTSDLLVSAQAFVEKLGKEGKTLLYVGTKDEILSLVRKSAEEIGSPYVTNRWIGGVLTNFSEIKKRIKRLIDLVSQGESGELERKYTKKERVMIGRELDKLTFNFGGIKELEKLPDALLIVDPRHNFIAIDEAKTLGIPVVGIMSSDSDINKVTYPVIANDSLQASVTFLLKELTGSYQNGKTMYTETPKKVESKEAKIG